MYEFSEKNNREAGLLITQADDWDAFQELSDEADSIINNAELKSSYDDRSANVDRKGLLRSL